MDYYFRESLYNLVELAILARHYEESLLGTLGSSAKGGNISFQQTLLKMKATEGKGRLVVAIHGEDPVGFYWMQESQKPSLWIHPEHKSHNLESLLLNWVQAEPTITV